MLAWAHFLLTELRPLYAILFATSLYAESKTLQVGIWGDKKSTCWVNQIYKNCAERCGHVWHGQRCPPALLSSCIIKFTSSELLL